MTLRLNGSSSGFTEINAPAAAGSNTLVLPTSNGSANQTLKNGSTAGTLEFVTHRGFVTYAIIADQKDYDLDGGTFTSGAWQTRDLNTEIADPDGIVSISSNQFTLSAGTYLIEAAASAHDVNRHQTRIYNATSTSVVQYGQQAYVGSGDGTMNQSPVAARVTITSDTAFEIQHRCQTTKASIGLGISGNFGDTDGKGIFTFVRIYKEA